MSTPGDRLRERAKIVDDPVLVEIAGVECALLSCCSAGHPDDQDIRVANIEALRRLGAQVCTSAPEEIPAVPASSVFVCNAETFEQNRMDTSSHAVAYLRLDADDELANAYADLLDYPVADEVVLSEVRMEMLAESLPDLIRRASLDYDLEIEDLDLWVAESGLREVFLANRELWESITMDARYGADGVEFHDEARLYEPLMEELVKHGLASKEDKTPVM